MGREPLVISARVTARLLGIRLLTLDARITASDAAPYLARPVPGSSGAARPELAGPVRAAGPAGTARAADRARAVDPVRAVDSTPPARSGRDGVTVPGPAPGASVARARELADQGAQALQQGHLERRHLKQGHLEQGHRRR